MASSSSSGRHHNDHGRATTGCDPSQTELSEEQWQAILPLFFSSSGFYGADAATEAESFRAFHAKYVRRVGARGGAGSSGGAQAEAPTAGAPDLELPQRFDPRYRINHAVMASGGSATDPLNLRGLPAEEARRLRRAGVGEGAVKEMRQQLHMFEDFQQKKQLAATQKLQADRRKLPVTGYAEHILASLRERSVLVLAGATGCGKSTQIPQLLLRAGYTRVVWSVGSALESWSCRCMPVLGGSRAPAPSRGSTQPRRLAAMALARRVALETQGEWGEGVGYQACSDRSSPP